MDLDRALLERAVRSEDPTPWLRVYRWLRPTLSIGAHQQLSAEVAERCRGSGVEIVQRPTGGGAVYHCDDLTYSVVAPRNGMSVLGAYEWVAAGLIQGLAMLGINAQVALHEPGQEGAAPAASRPASCFASLVGADLSVGGAKICGSAQVRRKGWFLQHGSIPVRDVRAETRFLLGHQDADPSTSIEALRPTTSWEKVAECVILGFVRLWGEPHLEIVASGDDPEGDIHEIACLNL
ncbi:MAG: hypothetical protein M3164_03670 [Actinomycetota bacterium]|nr:hypothetical protein [Actinomycetota bacterium]